MIEEFIKDKKHLIKLNQKSEIDIDILSKLINMPISILKLWDSWYNVDGKWYYFKVIDSIYLLFNELIGEQLAKYFSIDTVHYELAFCKSKNNLYHFFSDKYSYGIVSENFREKDKKYLSSIDLHIPCDSKNLSNLESKRVKKIFIDKDNYDLVIKKIIEMTILDFYMNQSDRRACNFCFSKDKNNFIDLCKLYDYENSFKYCMNEYENAILRLDLKSQNTLKYIRNNNVMQEQLYKLMDINIEKIINYIIDYYNITIPNDLKGIYIDNDERMKVMVKEYKLIK